MAGFVQAVAVDLDGTLTRDGVLSQDVLAAIDECRDTGVSLVVVTGRIRGELEREFPELVEHVDALVYENGAVLQMAGQLRRCAPAVDPLLGARLGARGVEFR